ncbi:putative holliday junction DNA helicase RuvA [Prochlorococcus marinus str. NATL1A]|uniref:Holliday junction branch migration complex subunit RuvA n=1 Tax=Prochlorococcus marinus (strain NATL1A) TaxID=167555 RepID=RUVA_PROM1|nr:Holliday junction branch migration protein RuvA [Prochlorococcus marinus]A2C1Y5.1 RecName: Full=Holliday junction branch migration complex subunit RuvA [Prochlorococcus marinus str. NATL1A]ABM75495.1 putative holliday junction DNA helicase RuvA [Prochlorococcus marinus str. NATL1A]
MISWLKGEKVHTWKISSRKGVVLNVGGVGYEIQLLPKQIDKAEVLNEFELWIHQIDREDGTSLYGFIEVNQRDLFREIISVNGIGPQIGMAMLEEFEVPQLVNAIENKESNLLTKTQGIGKRIAERLIVELRNKLQRFTDNDKTIHENKKGIEANQFSKYIDEIYLILNSLGYVDNEIKESIKIITINEKENSLLLNSSSAEEKAELMDKHLKEILMKLSEKTT